jgi:hypothetical protein
LDGDDASADAASTTLGAVLTKAVGMEDGRSEELPPGASGENDGTAPDGPDDEEDEG